MNLPDLRFALVSDDPTRALPIIREQLEAIALRLATLTGGTVTSVALSAPASILSVSGSPGTGAASLALALETQQANEVWAGPTTGADTTPTFRALVAADMPAAVTTGLALAAGQETIVAAGGDTEWTGTISNAAITATSKVVLTVNTNGLATPSFFANHGAPGVGSVGYSVFCTVARTIGDTFKLDWVAFA